VATFSNLVFAGGGSRCFWQAGFWSVYDPEGTETPERVVAVSAGAAMACMLFSGRTEFGLNYFKQQTARNARNFYPARALTGGTAFPHEAIYRNAIAATIDADALAALHAGPSIEVTMAGLPRWLGPQTATVAGILAYDLEKYLFRPVHPRFGRVLGFRDLSGMVRACATPQALTDLILASSGTPPFTPSAQFQGQTVLDGGLCDNVPVHPLADQPGETLVLLSRRYTELPKVAHRTYVQPSVKAPVSMWDYTNPQALQDTFDLGRRDADSFVRSTQTANSR
jgi:predicted acylesterase/phospholipase RssA